MDSLTINIDNIKNASQHNIHQKSIQYIKQLMKDEKSQIKWFDDEASTLLEYVLGVLENSNCKNFATIDIDNESYNKLCERLNTTNEDIISNYIAGKLSSMVD